MGPHPSSQDAEFPTQTTANPGDDGKATAVNRSISTTNGHANTVLEKTIEVLSSDAMQIEPSLEEGEEKADDGGTHSDSSDDGDGPHDVPLNNDKPNVCFSHLPPSS